MNEEEARRRCIILGICGPGQGAASGDQASRLNALSESLEVKSREEHKVLFLTEPMLAYVLGLIDEALGMGYKAKGKPKAKPKPKKKAKADR